MFESHMKIHDYDIFLTSEVHSLKKSGASAVPE